MSDLESDTFGGSSARVVYGYEGPPTMITYEDIAHEDDDDENDQGLRVDRQQQDGPENRRRRDRLASAVLHTRDKSSKLLKQAL